MKTIVLLLVILVGFGSCSIDKQKHVTDLFPPSTMLTHTVVSEEVFGLPTEMILNHDDILVKDLKSDSIMAVYNLKENIVTNRFMRFGQGPGEVIDYPSH